MHHTVAKEVHLMLLLLAIILGVAWILGFGVYHVASAAIHILLILALVSIVLHFVRGVSGRRVV
ncbi:MAG TPA: lmo0937 family membrane protein [Polyangia bacterium]|nr:lmo0937 family membrane protein [Polyangia bacterium]